MVEQAGLAHTWRAWIPPHRHQFEWKVARATYHEHTAACEGSPRELVAATLGQCSFLLS